MFESLFVHATAETRDDLLFYVKYDSKNVSYLRPENVCICDLHVVLHCTVAPSHTCRYWSSTNGYI